MGGPRTAGGSLGPNGWQPLGQIILLGGTVMCFTGPLAGSLPSAH